MPGQDVIAGYGWVVEIPGIVITPGVARSGHHLEPMPTIEMMCGCPITTDGLGRAEDYIVEASLWQEECWSTRWKFSLHANLANFWVGCLPPARSLPSRILREKHRYGELWCLDAAIIIYAVA